VIWHCGVGMRGRLASAPNIDEDKRLVQRAIGAYSAAADLTSSCGALRQWSVTTMVAGGLRDRIP
jgi:hypothetical protein